jgi:hypothetical protein
VHPLQRGKPGLKGLRHESGNKEGSESTQKGGSFPHPHNGARGQMLLSEPHSVVLVFADNTANITVKYGQFNREHAKFHYLPVLISDNGVPSLTGTSTLTVGVCKCNEQGEFTFCEEMAAQAGVSIQALVAIFLCILTITGQCLMGQGGDIERASQKRQGSGPILHHSGAYNSCIAYRDIDVEPHQPGA